MTLRFQTARRLLLSAGFFSCFAGRWFAQTVLNDSFESGRFSNPWGLTNGVSITNTGGTNGTTHFAKFAAFRVRASSDLALLMPSGNFI